MLDNIYFLFLIVGQSHRTYMPMLWLMHTHYGYGLLLMFIHRIGFAKLCLINMLL